MPRTKNACADRDTEREGDWSTIAVSHSGGRSRLTSCRCAAPLKILNPRLDAPYCTAILSSYGGGLVAGDQVHLQICCGAGATLFLGTQAFTKVYRSPAGLGSSQQLDATIGPGGCVVAFPDPVVPYADSTFHQEQRWELEENALLILVDGSTAGRLERGERFHYDSYASDIAVSCQGQQVLVERLLVQPDKFAPQRTGAFGAFTASMNLYVVGSPDEVRFALIRTYLEARLQAQVQTQLQAPRARDKMCNTLISFAQPRPQVFVARALGRTTAALNELVDLVGAAVAAPEILGENPRRRKY